MKITIKEGSKEALRLKKLVSLGYYKNPTDATTAAINSLYQSKLAEETERQALRSSQENFGVDLYKMQGLNQPGIEEDNDDQKSKKPSKVSRPAKISASPR